MYKTMDSVKEEKDAPSPLDPSDTDEDIIDHGESRNEDDDVFEDTVEEKSDWLSATRTLGSLFLRQEDADRDKGVDVFGRPLAFEEDEKSTMNQEHSLAQYLMQLKHQEEDNRERASSHHRNGPKGKAKDGVHTKQKTKGPIDPVSAL